MYSPASLGNILIVDDDKAIVDLLCFNFKSEGYSVKVVSGPSEVTAKTIADVHLMLVDDAHNDHSGIDLISRLRDTPQGASLGIIFYSGFENERDLIEALDAGADDCMAKPFSLRGMLARVRAVMRRRRRDQAAKPDTNIINFKSMTVDLTRKEAYISGKPAGLSNTEFAILELLLRNMSSYTSRIEIFRTVWPSGVGSNERIVDTNISRLRRKLGTVVGACIVNRTGLGYMITE